jgi:hypothetical protein
MARDSYVEKRSDIFAQIWKSAQKDDQDMAIWLPETYDRISRLLTEESRRLSDLFFSEDEEEEEENNDSAYHQLCVRFFEKISQDFETRLRDILKQDVKTCVVNFTRLFGLTRDFATSRFDDVVVQDAILKPYRHFQKRYGELETEHLTSCLENLNLERRMMTNKIDHADASMIASEALSSLFLRFETAIDRCVQFTNGIETSSLFNAIEMTLTEFVSTLKDFVQKVRSQKPVEKVKKKKVAQDVDDLFDVGGDEEKETSPSSSGNGIMGAVQLVLVSFRLYVVCIRECRYWRETLKHTSTQVRETGQFGRYA